MLDRDLFDDGSEPSRDALLSACGTYRYRLWRRWGRGPLATFVMLNPSTADAMKDDPTIRRCIGFAKREGCGKLLVVNLFAYRATDPADLKRAEEPVGPLNGDVLDEVAMQCQGPLIVAWGNHGDHQGQAGEFLTRLSPHFRKPLCLGTTRSGHPKHPLRLGADTLLRQYVRAA